MPTLTEERPTTEERVSRIECVPTHLATKADVAEVETRITQRIAEAEARTNKQLAEVRVEIIESEARTNKQIAEARANRQIAEFRDAIAKSETREVRWMLTLCGIGIAAITITHRLMG